MRDLRQILSEQDLTVNGWVSADSPYLAETLSHAGFDCVTVDVQHGMLDLGGAIGLLQGIALGPAVPMARTPRLDAAIIGKLLDAGARAIICPTVDSPAQAAEFVAACRYPPVGGRSYGPARAQLGAGGDGTAEPMTWAMIESAPAMAQLDAIVATEGLDAVYVGPNDLALALGAAAGSTVPPPVVLAAMERIVAAAHDAGLWAGSFCSNGAVARQVADLGFDLVTTGSDMALLRAAAGREIALARGQGAPPGESAGY